MSITFGAEAEFLSAGAADYISVAALGVAKFVVAYTDRSGPNHGKARVGTVSGGAVSFGDEAEFGPNDSEPVFAAPLGAGAVVVAYRNAVNHGVAKVGIVSGTGVTFGAAAEFAGAGAAVISVATLSPAKFAVAYGDNSGLGTAKVGEVSGTGIAFGAAAQFNAAVTPYISAAAVSAAAFIVAFRDNGNAGGGRARVGSVSGAAIAFGASTGFSGPSAAESISAVALSPTMVVVAYALTATGDGAAAVGTVSGASVAFGAPAAFLSAAYPAYVSAAAISATAFVVAYENQADSSHGGAKLGAVSGSAVAFGAEAEFLPANGASFVSAAALGGGAFVVAYKDMSDSNHGTARAGDTTTLAQPESDSVSLSDAAAARVGAARPDSASLADAAAAAAGSARSDSVAMSDRARPLLFGLLLHADSAVAHHVFAGPVERLRGLEWSALSGAPAFGAGRIGGSIAAAGGGPLAFGSPSPAYGTLHGAERFAVAMWVMDAWEPGASVFVGFLGAGRAPVDGVRLLAESPDAGSTFPLWAELMAAGAAYRFPAALPDMDPARPPGPRVPHLLVLQLDRRGGVWSLESSMDGGGFASSSMSAPRLRGPDVDLPSQTPGDESYFGIELSGPAALDELVFWRAGDGLRRAHTAGLMDLWTRFRSPMSSWTARFGSDRHAPPPMSRGRLGTQCLVDRPPAVSAPSGLHMDVEAGSLPRENELELLASDPDGGAVSWSVSSPASFGEVGLRPLPRGAGVVVAYAPVACGGAEEDSFVLRAESRCGLGEDVTVTVSVSGAAPCTTTAAPQPTTTAPPVTPPRQRPRLRRRPRRP